MSKTIELVIKPYTTKDLAPLYNMSTRTFLRNIEGIKEKLGSRKGHFYSIKQVEIIIEHMGIPYKIKEENAN
jgi:hypothetical protein